MNSPRRIIVLTLAIFIATACNKHDSAEPPAPLVAPKTKPIDAAAMSVMPADAPVAPETPILSDAIVDSYIAARRDANANPFDNVCTGSGGAVALRMYETADGQQIADAWVRRHGFDSVDHYIAVAFTIVDLAELVVSRKTDPTAEPLVPHHAADIALVTRRISSIRAADAEARTRGKVSSGSGCVDAR